MLLSLGKLCRLSQELIIQQNCSRLLILYRSGDTEGSLTSAERQELTTLRRELKRVRMERDFLKKAATFFARESSDPMS